MRPVQSHAHPWLLLKTDLLPNCHIHLTLFLCHYASFTEIKYGVTAYQLVYTDRKDGYIDFFFQMRLFNDIALAYTTRWHRYQIAVAADWLQMSRFPQNNRTPPSFADWIFEKCFLLLATDSSWNRKGTPPRLTEWELSWVAWRLVTWHRKLRGIVWRLLSVPDCLV